MAGINLSDNIAAKGRNLHLQTSLANEDELVLTELFDGGRLLVTEKRSVPQGLSGGELEEYVESLHMGVLQEIELLYDISLKIKTVKHAKSLCSLGARFLHWRLLDEAVSELELSLNYDESNGRAYKYLAEAYTARGAMEEAVEVLKRGVSAFPEYPDLWLCLGRALSRHGDPVAALNAFRKARDINSGYDEAYFHIAKILAETGMMEELPKGVKDRKTCFRLARENLTRASAASNRFKTVETEEIMRLFHQNQWEQGSARMQEVIDTLEPVIDLEFDNAFYLSLLYGEKGRNFEAVQAYVETMEHLVHKHPDFPDIHNKLGIAYLIECRNLFTRALHHFKKAGDLNPDYEESLRNLKLAKNDGKGLLLLLRAMLK